ncbi:type III pantothenate kinase [Thioalkalivibrio versutus]|uniref:type III pantothenate kinase n=1 Tax=Thioalkalivibrio versutus TaxID=106634 RepID=UPI00037C5514|nr:type III pantothenate kinase [Thioalkalivibrio versutus]OOC51149.1 type III pantothenate kinase [Thioalkalivibrio versutus]
MADIALVDIGSTRVKWQVRNAEGEVLGSGANRDPAGCVRGLASMAREAPLTAVWLSRVGPGEREEAFSAELASAGIDAPVHAVTVPANGPHGLRIDYAAGQLGVDRYCALVAARARCDAPMILVDAGTAVTVDVLEADGRHAGGYLLPGRQLGWEALQTRLTDRIAPREATQWPDDLETAPGLNSTEALERGWSLGLAGALDGLIARSRTAERAGAACWLTGGDAYWLAPVLRAESTIFPNLVLDGLWELSRWEGAECAG